MKISLLDVQILEPIASSCLDLAIVAQAHMLALHATIDLGAIEQLHSVKFAHDGRPVVVFRIRNVSCSVRNFCDGIYFDITEFEELFGVESRHETY